MSKSNVLSTSGFIYKREIVRSIKIKSISDHLILESADPFPEVHHKDKASLPNYFYIAVDPCYLDQDIVHLAKYAERSIGEEIDTAVGDITLQDKKFTVLRIKNLKPKLLSKIIEVYKEKGVKLYSFGRNINDSAIIHIRKFFYLEEIEKGFYFDLDENEKGYVEIPRKFNWNDFQELVHQVKKDCEYDNFDSAFGVISKHGVYQDIIRIYSPRLDEDRLLSIGKSFLKDLFL